MAEEKHEALPSDEEKPLSSPASAAKPVTVDDDSDPDFDDLDDVLDQFSSVPDQSKPQANAQPQPPTPSASGPGRPPSSSSSSEKTPTTVPLPLESHLPDSEGDFMARLASEMSSVLGNLNPEPSATSASAEDMGKELDEFTSAMEKQGVNPADLLKAILGDTAESAAEIFPNTSTTQPKSPPPTRMPTKPDSSEKESFDSTIRRTMERIQASDSHATTTTTTTTAAATTEAPLTSEEDMLATLLQAMESSGGGSSNDPSGPDSEDPLSQMFLGMMEQLTNKDMLYEPMKELDSKYPEWLIKNKGSLPEEDYKRYVGQRGMVREIVAKFEERGYSDEQAGCREFIWERMQRMQRMGSPPEDLVANPYPSILGGLGGGGGGGDGKEDDAGCATQ